MQRLVLVGLFCFMATVRADTNFEDIRCRCVCPSTEYFIGENRTDSGESHRRFYTMTNMNPTKCNPHTVVAKEVTSVIDDAHLDAFLANCECRHESRNMVLIKVVVIFVMCLLALLVAYMTFLVFIDPLLRARGFGTSSGGFNYRHQSNEIEANIFAANQ
ncbi:hypothetical protein PFISCL1PPCAC_6614, partial [Pristionchus fissidentatus]